MGWWMAAAALGSAVLKNINQGEKFNKADALQTRWSPFTGAGYAQERPQSDKIANLLQAGLMGADSIMKDSGGKTAGTEKATAKPAVSSDGGIPLQSSNPKNTGNTFSLFDDNTGPSLFGDNATMAEPAAAPTKYLRSSGAASRMKYNPNTGEWYDL